VLVVIGLAVAVFITAVTPRGTSSVVAPSSPVATAGSRSSGAESGGSAASSTGTSSAGMSSTGTSSTGTSSSGTVIYVHIVGQINKPGLYALREGDRAVDAVAVAGGLTASADPAALNLARLLSDGEQIFVPAVGESPPAAASAAGSPLGGKVNINTADESTLESLPRVGPAMAARIIAWRTANGRFTAIEDLMSVSGIGEKTFDGLKDLVTT
jgi:competence protein ComEA